MRELEFRQPMLNHNNEFIRFHYLGYTNTGTTEFTTPVWGGEKSEQYTGLKDKNGVKIYEGDIIVYKNTIEEGRGVIDFSAGFIITWILSTVKTNSPSLISCLYYLQCPQELEVIGNIHQHPELLKTNK